MQSRNLMSNWNQVLLCRTAGIAVFLSVLFTPLLGQAQEHAVDEAATSEVMLVEEIIELPAATTLERIAANGAVRFGYRSDARPFSYQDDAGQAAGYSIVLCNRIADSIRSRLGQPGLKVEWVPIDTDDRFSKVADGTVDMLCAADTVTLSRREEVSFSLPIFPGGIGALLRADAAARLRLALEGQSQKTQPLWRGNPATILQNRTFSVVSGTVAEAWLAERLDTFDVAARVQAVEAYDAGIEAVLSGKSDALFGDRSILQDAAKRSARAGDLKVLDRLFTLEPFALALPRGDDEFRLLVDRTLSDLYSGGEFAALFSDSFGEPNEKVLLFFLINTQPQ